MREDDWEVMNYCPLSLSENSKRYIWDQWEKEVMNLNVPLSKNIRGLAEYWVTHSDKQGVILGSV